MRLIVLIVLALSLSSTGGQVVDGPRPAAMLDSLNVGLIAYWALEEASGTRVDSEPTAPAHDLADNNTVTSGTGIVGNAALFVAANNESLTETDTADISTGDIDFSCTLWLKLVTKTTSQSVIGHWGASAGTRSWRLWYNSSSSRFDFHVSSDGSATSVTNTASTFGVPATNTWYFIYVSHDSVNNAVNISVNDGAVDSTSYSSGSFNATAEFQMGGFGSGGFWVDGYLDQVRFYKKVLTAAEVTRLYNGGTGM